MEYHYIQLVIVINADAEYTTNTTPLTDYQYQHHHHSPPINDYHHMRSRVVRAEVL